MFLHGGIKANTSILIVAQTALSWYNFQLRKKSAAVTVRPTSGPTAEPAFVGPDAFIRQPDMYVRTTIMILGYTSVSCFNICYL